MGPHGLRRLWSRLKLFGVLHICERLTKAKASQFFHILFGPIYFQLLSSAIQFDLFTLLSRHPQLTRSEIARRLGIEKQPARALLSGLSALGLIRRTKAGQDDDPSYRNAWHAERYLTRHAPESIVHVVELYHVIVYRPMFHLAESIKRNANIGLGEFPGDEPTLYQRLSHTPELEQIFQKALEQISRSANTQLAEFVDLSRVRHLVDIGGGNGENIITLAKQYPRLRASVFDWPSVCALAAHNIQAHGLGDRLRAISGDCFSDAFPQDADCFLFSHFFEIFSEERGTFLLKKCVETLPKGGMVIIFSIMLRDDEAGPLTAVAGHPYFLALATGQGFIYSAKEYETWLKGVGFSQTRRIALPRDHVAVLGIK